ncbi:type III secretion inner membrane ring lipoprotein SctJ [Ochrobactrum sp. Marseille-Q0166]|uniref:type III secretion system inner membrane ring lipoprotein SctJ n=1 Tax=Ochrobactrum sp. Marseille-Q0166 TaxID=2761105 RepID=UPI00165589A4|nr:type III secretion inner membrane ring lipoprotein SctJ [Ochrobactrum sp. Marseille-Q0166]MBC8719591.1 type III secretion inner membrane ring lipoprotein SctJ [Ochrobactrum sp. Marseille-Q0166]
MMRPLRSKLFFLMAVLVILAGCEDELNRGLDEREANLMMSNLLKHNIGSSKQSQKDGTVKLFVERSKFAKAVELLESLKLPRPKYVNVGELFKDTGLISNPLQEWARFVYARSQELAKSISEMPGVVSAEVHIASPRKVDPFTEVTPPSASVLVVIEPELTDPAIIPQIKSLISYSIENMSYDRVAVVVSRVEPASFPVERVVTVAGFSVPEAQLSKVFTLILVAGLAISVAAGVAFSVLWRIFLRRRTIDR